MPKSDVRHATDIVVVGGGFAGLAAGSVLAATGLKVTVLDAGPAASFRGELIHPGGVRALTNLGLRPELLSSGAVPVPGFAAYEHSQAQPILLPYPEQGGLGLAVDHEQLVAALRADFLQRPGATLVKARAEKVLAGATGVRTSDGTEYVARLLVVADGRHSSLRKQLGLPTRVKLLSYTLAPVLEGALLPHPGYGHVFVGAPGPVLAYPFGHDRVRMCIDVPTGIAGGRAGLIAYVREHYSAHVPEPLRSGMLAALERGDLGGSANHAVSTDHCVLPGIALIGDAAGCSHPVTATGLTTALNDISVLAESIAQHGLSDAALKRYELLRYRFSRAREVFAQSLFEVVRGATPGARGLCEGMFQYWRRSERARLASMAILSGDASSPTAFVNEYGRVMARSVYESVRQRPMRRAPSRLSAMFGTASECLDLAVQRALASARLEVAQRPVSFLSSSNSAALQKLLWRPPAASSTRSSMRPPS